MLLSLLPRGADGPRARGRGLGALFNASADLTNGSSVSDDVRLGVFLQGAARAVAPRPRNRLRTRPRTRARARPSADCGAAWA
jgi:hypothetical protein